MIKRISLLVILLVGCYLWYTFVWAPSPSEKSRLSSSPAAAKKPPQSYTTEENLSKEDLKEAEIVARKYLEVYFGAPRQTPMDLADQLKSYASEMILSSIRESMKVDPPHKIKNISLSPVTPPYLPGGVTYHAVITTDQEELDYWFSMLKIDGQWKVVQEEVGLGGSD